MSAGFSSVKLAVAAFMGFVSAFAGSVGARAQNASQTQNAPRCLCETARDAGGTLSRLQGDVSVLSGAGYSPAADGQAVALGSRVLVGAGGGLLSIGRSCSIELEANTNYDVSLNNQKLCLIQSRNAFTPPAQAAAGSAVMPLAVGGLVLGGIGAGVAIGLKGGASQPYVPISK